MSGDNNTPPATAPSAAAGNLRQLMLETSTKQAEESDLKLADEIQNTQDAAAAATLNDQERQQAAAAGSVMAVAFMEMLLQGGLELGGIDEKTKGAVQGVIDKGRKDFTDSLAPVLLKHAAEPPAAVAKLKEELMLAFRFIMLAVGVFLAIKKGTAAAKLAAAPKAATDPAEGAAAAAAA